MAELPPMLAAPGAAGLRRLEDERRGAGRRATVERRAAYRAAMLRWCAQALEAPGMENPQPAGAHFDLTPEQAASARKALATVLRNRADGNGGRLGRA